MISVIIPVHNAERFLPTLLDSLVGQCAAGGWEIVAVDNRSTDRSREVIERYRDRLPLRVVSASEKANPSFARNVGVLHAAGDLLIFVDADDALAPRYVELMAHASDAETLVTSRVDSVSLNPEWVRDAQGSPWQSNEIQTFFGFLPATGVNIAVRRELFARAGGFPEEFSGSEDIAFSWRAQMAGGRIQLVPDAVYRYRYRDTLTGLFWQAVNWGRDNARLYAVFREHGMPPRTLAEALREWAAALAGLLRSRSQGDRAAQIVRLGFCVGRARGCLKYRVAYF